MMLCAVGILGSSFVLFSSTWAYVRGDAAYEEVRQVRNLPKDSIDQAPGSEEEKGAASSVDFGALEKINGDVVGWMIAEGTEIDYPVVQGTDNDFYLRHLFTRERNKLGSIFMDHRNQRDFSDQQTIIYGHNMKDGSMFSSLTKYKDQGYYDSAPTMQLYTPGDDFEIAWFAGVVVDGNEALKPFDFRDEHDLQRHIDALKRDSTFEAQTMVGVDDRIITLLTCSYEFTNARYALYGKLIH